MRKKACLLFALLTPALFVSAQTALPGIDLPEDGIRALSIEKHPEMSLQSAVYDPAGAWVAVFQKEYADRRDEWWISKQEGFEGPYDGNPTIVLSPDGTRLAYSAEGDSSEYYVVVDDNRYGPYSKVSNLQFSPDGTRLAYFVREKGETAKGPVIDGERLGNGEELRFFADHRYFYSDYKGGHSVVTDTGRSGPWAYIPIINTVPDGSDILYTARHEDDSNWICTADARYGPFITATAPVIMEDGHTPLFIASSNQDGSTYWARHRGSEIVAGPFPQPQGAVGLPSFSGDGKRSAFIVKQGIKYYIEETKSRLGPFDEVRGIEYAPDDSAIAAEVMSAYGEIWIYGHDYKAGPFLGWYPKPGQKKLISWSIGGDGFLTVNVRDQSDSGVADEIRRYPPGSGLFEPIELQEPKVKTSPWSPFPGIYRIKGDDGSSLRCSAGTFGPYSGTIAVYAATASGGALYSVRQDGRYRLYGDGALLLDIEEDLVYEIDESKEGDRVISLRLDDRYTATIAVARDTARGVTLVDSDTSTAEYIDLSGAKPAGPVLKIDSREASSDRSQH